MLRAIGGATVGAIGVGVAFFAYGARKAHKNDDAYIVNTEHFKYKFFSSNSSDPEYKLKSEIYNKSESQKEYNEALKAARQNKDGNPETAAPAP